MPNHRSINKCKYMKQWRKASHRSNNNIITTQTNKQTNKKTKKQAKKSRLWNKQTCICIVLIQWKEKKLMKFLAVYAKTLKTMKCLPKILFNINIVDLCLLLCFCILFKKRLESVAKVYTSEVVLAIKISEPLVA